MDCYTQGLGPRLEFGVHGLSPSECYKSPYQVFIKGLRHIPGHSIINLGYDSADVFLAR